MKFKNSCRDNYSPSVTYFKTSQGRCDTTSHLRIAYANKNCLVSDNVLRSIIAVIVISYRTGNHLFLVQRYKKFNNLTFTAWSEIKRIYPKKPRQQPTLLLQVS